MGGGSPGPGSYDGLSDYLLQEVPGLVGSPELEAGDRNRPADVAGALGRYLLRLQASEVRRETAPSESAALARAYAVLDALAASEDTRVRAALVDEIFAPLHADDVVVAAVETRLGPEARRLYRRWAV